MKKFQEKYPYYTIKEDEASKTIYFQHDSETTYTPEELLAMFLEFAKEIASDFAGISKIKENETTDRALDWEIRKGDHSETNRLGQAESESSKRLGKIPELG